MIIPTALLAAYIIKQMNLWLLPFGIQNLNDLKHFFKSLKTKVLKSNLLSWGSVPFLSYLRVLSVF